MAVSSPKMACYPWRPGRVCQGEAAPADHGRSYPPDSRIIETRVAWESVPARHLSGKLYAV